MKIECETVEVVKINGENTLKKGIKILEFSDNQVREKTLCTICQHSAYPRCQAHCNNWK